MFSFYSKCRASARLALLELEAACLDLFSFSLFHPTLDTCLFPKSSSSMYIPILSSTICSGRWCKPPGLELAPCNKSFLKQVTFDDVSFAQLLTTPGKKLRESRVHDRTGYSPYILNLMWDRYKKHLDCFRPSESKKDMTKCYFLLAYVWIHLKPTSRNVDAMMWTQPTDFISETVSPSISER